jgi:GNAT superfamily N-acetyltransferase
VQSKALIMISNLAHRRAKTFFDYLSLRKLRNLAFHLLTTHPKKISLVSQIFFYLRRHNHEIYIFSYRTVDVGYVLLKKELSLTFVTILVNPKYHGVGIGTKAITTTLNLYCKERDIYAEVDRNNVASVNLFKSIGFRVFDAKNKFLIYVSNPSLVNAHEKSM